MKAWLSQEPGGPESLVLKEIDKPAPGLGQILVRVLAVGINYPDALLIRDQYQVKAPRPFAPGAEFSGVVEAVGKEATQFAVGALVMGRCGWGALAEYIAIDQVRCVRLPATVSPVDAAGFMFVYATAYHALRDVAEIRAGETMLVLGAAGGVGSAAIDLARALSARVIVAASTKEKLDYALARGATNGIVYSETLDDPAAQRELAQAFKELVGPEGADVVFDPVGGCYSEPALRSLKPGGRHLVVGFPAGIPRLPLNLVLLKRCKVLGVDWRGFVVSDPAANERNIESLFAMWREGSIHPDVSASFSFMEAPAAIQRVEGRQALGKIIVTVAEQQGLASLDGITHKMYVHA
jgi:NADPH2:quinone reductase